MEVRVERRSTTLRREPVRTICLSSGRVVAFIATLVVLCAASRDARADGAFDGKWSMSPMGASYTVREWVVSSCGPAPVPGAEGGGGPVTIHQEGDELVIVGGRVFRTNMCWDMFQMPTEQRVAQLAADGLGTPDIARTLYVSPKTVEWHLDHVYRKLAIRSRRQLPGALSPPSGTDRGAFG